MNRLTAAEWTELYEALQVLKAQYEAHGLETQCLEVQSIYMLQICPIPQPEHMEV